MRILKAVGCALTITAISMILLTIIRGTPTLEQFLRYGAEMTALAFLVLFFTLPKS